MKEIPLKYIAQIQKGKLPKELTDKSTGNLPIYLSMDVMRGRFEEAKYVKDYESCISAKEGDVLVLWDGSNAGEVLLSKDGIISSTVALLSIKESVDKRFFFYQLKSKENELRNSSVGMGIPHVNPQELNSFNFLIPSFDKQQKIATYLDRKTAEIDSLISDQTQLLELYEEEKIAIINDLVTGKIVFDGKEWTKPKKVKNSGIEWLGEVPEEWEVKRFDFLFSFSRGLSITKANLQDEGIPCVTYGEIHSKYGFELIPEIHPLKCVSEDYMEKSEKSLLKHGDFIFADTSEDLPGSGAFTYLNSDVPTFAGYHTIVGVPKKDFIHRYIAYYFESLPFRNQIRSQVSGTKVYSITQAILKFTKILFPPIKEQNIIVDYLDKKMIEIDTKIKKAERSIELMKEYREALISEVVTGKIKIE